MTSIRSSLGGLPSGPTSDEVLEGLARRAWRERGVVILWPERIIDDWDRQHVLNLAEQTYGKRPI